jgi:predicted esterase YcpF (UPF0227 family)
MHIAFFHGLESSAQSEKSRFLHQYYAAFTPSMSYQDPELFELTLLSLQKQKIDLLVGSSMGGFFAYHLSTIINIPTLLFNPAFVQRSIHPIVQSGSFHPHQTIILGDKDEVIPPAESLPWIQQHVQHYTHHFESMGHRTPIDIFEKWIRRMENIG